MRVKTIATEASEIQAILGIASRARPPPPPRLLELDFAAAAGRPLHPCVRCSEMEPLEAPITRGFSDLAWGEVLAGEI